VAQVATVRDSGTLVTLFQWHSGLTLSGSGLTGSRGGVTVESNVGILFPIILNQRMRHQFRPFCYHFNHAKEETEQVLWRGAV
jgi:hypothetical protein